MDSHDSPDYEAFDRLLKESAAKFNKISKSESIKVIGHLDADGICSSAIIVHALVKLNRKYSLTILPTLTEDSLSDLVDDPEKHFVFVDLGSGSVDIVGKVLKNKEVFILDHHMLQSETDYANITQVNPHICGIDGSNEISGAGVTFLFSRKLVGNDEMSRIAIVGAIGDVQENNGFKKLNNDILSIAVQNNLIEVRRGLKFFGVQTRPIHKVLQYSSEILIPGVTGSESGSISFLTTLGIDPKLKNGWKKLSDLSDDEKKRLVAAIIMKGSKPTDIFANNYLLKNEDESTPFRDAKEFATLLNSCGRLNKASIGIGACLNDKRMKSLAMQNLSDYRKQIVNALNWYKDNQNTEKVIKEKNYILINAGEEILPTMIGTLGSILSKNVDIPKNTFILSMARNHDDTTKISLRVTGNDSSINLKEIIERIISSINHGSSGGHSFAAGAVISTDYEDAFMKTSIEVMGSIMVEEKLNS